MSASRPRPEPGWHPDPSGAPCWRWWDGSEWTAHTRPVESRSAPQPEWRRARDRPPRLWAPEGGGWGPPAAPAGEGGNRPATRIPARAAWWGLLGILVGEVLGLVLSVVAAAASGSTSGSGVVLAGEIGLWAGLFGTCVMVSRRYGTGSLAADFGLAVRGKDALAGLLAWVTGLVVAAVLGAIFAHTRFSGSNTQLLTGQKHSGVGFVVVTLIAALGAPFFEELFFRGFLRTALRARIGPIWAIWAQAGLFGLAHFQPGTGLGNVSVIVVIAGFGVVLGYAAHFTRRLAAGMMAHGLFNTFVAILIFTG